jgi:DNA end-binding protein Ku
VTGNKSKFDDQYEDALKDLLKKKQESRPIERTERREPTNVVNLMDALRRSLEASSSARNKGKASPARRGAVEKPEQPNAERRRPANPLSKDRPRSRRI